MAPIPSIRRSKEGAVGYFRPDTGGFVALSFSSRLLQELVQVSWRCVSGSPATGAGIKLAFQASAKLSVCMMEVSINNQRGANLQTHVPKTAPKGGGANFNLRGADFKNPYQSNPIID